MRVRRLRVASGWRGESLRGPKAQKGNGSGRYRAAPSEQALQVVETAYREDRGDEPRQLAGWMNTLEGETLGAELCWNSTRRSVGNVKR
jgi:hypothetical protein